MENILTNCSDLTVGEIITNKTICILDTEKLVASNGTDYLVYFVYDKNTHVFRSAPVFLNRQQFDTSMLLKNTLADVSAEIGEFKGNKNISIKTFDNLRNISEEQIILEVAGVQETLSKYQNLISTIKDQKLKNVALDFINNYNHDIIKIPSAKAWHDNTYGGLLQHSIKVHDIALNLYSVIVNDMDEYSIDIIKFGSLLHDMGKLVEFDFSKPKIQKTTRSRLIYHISDGMLLLQPYLDRHQIDTTTKMHINHIILSHHGEKEFGSPVKPSTIESLVIHYADISEANIKGFLNISKGLKPSEGKWIDFKEQFIYNLKNG